MARGIDARMVIPDPAAAKSVGEQETFDRDTTEEHFARARLRQMADRLLAKLRAEHRTARTLEVRIRYNDFDDSRRSESFPEPTDLESDVYPVIDRLLRRAWERRVSLRLVGLKFSNLYAAGFQDTLALEWGPPPAPSEKVKEDLPCYHVPRGRRHDAAQAVDRIREDHGPGAILRGHDLFLKEEGRQKKEEESGRNHLNPNGGSGGMKSRQDASGPRGPNSLHAACFLNMRSSFSFLDSLLSPEDAVRAAAERGARFAALTDPNLHGAVEFCQAAREAGIRPILAATVKIHGQSLLAYVKDVTGYKNLCAILSGQGKAPSTGGLILVPETTFPEVRYAEAAERPMYQILQSIRTLTLLDTRAPAKRRGHFHFPAAGAGAETAEIIGNILDECTFTLPLGGLNFPHYHPKDGSSPHEFLARLAGEGLVHRYGRQAGNHRGQLAEELEIIAAVGYEEYFLLVWDILQDCRREGIDWITRGSAADSLVCYCLGISDVCPIRFELYFKRFLNRDRMVLNKLPDIDVDFAHDRKDLVVDLIFEKYGAHAAVVGGFSTYRGRSAFADIAKVFGVSEQQIRRYTEHLPNTSAARVMEAATSTRECGDLDFGENPYATALALAKRLDGFPRHPKMHPCGIVLSRAPVATMCPLFTSHKGRPTTHFDMDAVEAIGLVKMDILAQGGLAVMRDAREGLGISSPPPHLAPCPPDPSFADLRIWKMISSGNARGVHHIESPAMTSLNRMVNVKTIDDLIAIVSVIRPGAANTMRKVSFARRAQGLEAVEYPHPSLEPVLRSTYGVVAYEEHILQICEAFANMPAGRADMLRRALVKNKADKAEAFFDEFAGHARQSGRKDDDIARVWQLIMRFKGYAFCRAHSTAYGIEAYQAAWLKCYHPAEFLAAVLTHGKGFYDRLTYSIECRRLGINFLPPDVNLSTDRYHVTHAVVKETPQETSPFIRPPLSQIKGLSSALLGRWNAQKPFHSFRDFYLRTRPSVSEMDTLIRVGALDGFGPSRVEQFWEARRLLFDDGDSPLFDPGETRSALPLFTTDPLPAERLRDEMELLGFAVSGHPLEIFPTIAWETYCPISKLADFPNRTVTLAGMILTDRAHHQSDGRPMKFLSLCDPTGIIECELFAGAYARFGLETIRHPIVEITATVQPFENHNGCTLNVRSVRKAREHHRPVGNPCLM
jgi:error-prone DNA polymerase